MSELNIGSRLRDLRRRRKLSLRALSRATGVALSFLSSLERGNNSVSVDKLKIILEALGTSLGEFFSREPEQPDKIVYRKEELTEIAGRGSGLSFKDVAAGRAGRTLQLLFETYAPAADTGPRLYSHRAEEAGMVLKGKLELTVDGQVFVLRPGDAYYFDSRRPHRVRNIGKSKAEAVSVNTPPSF